MNYRKEIDGLRALAVLPVIFFHAGFRWFSGGFVGVDVFFVISGYLITTIITSEMQKGTFSIVRFYERRARRILPALFFVILVCLPFAWRLSLPNQLKEFSKSLVAVCLFISNILFWKESGYFAAAAEEKPLLHTWSLAVEEQYYVIFPLFIILFWRFGKTWLLRSMFILLLISFLLAQIGGNIDFKSFRITHAWSWWSTPDWGFFLAPARGWELLIGALASFMHFPLNEKNKHTHQTLSFLGFVMILYSIFTFNGSTPFPSLYALLPTLGTAFIILFAKPETWVGRILSHPWAVGVGLISYSTYLWHQPLFAFARMYSFNNPSVTTFLVLSIASVGLGYLSWRFVENPFREKRRFSRNAIFMSSFLMSVFIMGIGVIGYVNNGFAERYPNFVPEKTNEATACKLKPINSKFPFLTTCEFGDLQSKRTVALYGDSHATAIFSSLDKTLKEEGIRGIRVVNEKCEVIPRAVVSYKSIKPSTVLAQDCLASMPPLMDYLRKNTEAIVVSIRWTYKMFPIENIVDSPTYDNGEGGVEFNDNPKAHYYVYQNGDFSVGPSAKEYAIKDLLDRLLSTERRIILNYPVPENGWDIPSYNLKEWRRTRKFSENISTSHANFKKRHRFVEHALDAYGEHRNLKRIKPESLLCDTFIPNRCVAQWNSIPLYFDDDHLSNAGSQLVVNEIIKALK